MNTTPTPKKWKVMQLVGVMLVIPSWMMAYAGLGSVKVALVLLLGLSLFLFARLAVWWNHG